MKIKKILALVLALAMLLSVLAGCNADKPEETKGEENKPAQSTPVENTEGEVKEEIVFPLAETLEVSVMAILGNSAYSMEDNIAWKHLQEISNIKFNTTEFAPSDAAEKMNLLMSSGQYTDVLFKANKIDLNQYGMDGILIPLEDLIREYCPNLCAVLDERDAWHDIAAPDGHIYSVPNVIRTAPNVDGGSGWWINKNWLDKLNLSVPTSAEELYTVLKAFKEQDPNGNGKADEIPMVAYTNNQSYSFLLDLLGEGLGYPDYWSVVDGQMEYLPTTEFFKENLLEFFNKMYTEGLLNADMFTMDRDQFRATCGGEEVIYGMVFDSSCVYFADVDEQLDWVLLRPFDENFALNKGVRPGGFAITDKCENPEIMMAWVDYLYSEEGGRVFRNGVEGVTYKINEDGTWENITEGFESVTYQGTLMGTANVPGKVPDLYYDKPASIHTQHLNSEWYGAEGMGAKGALVPVISLTEEENDEYNILFTDINAYVKNYIAECTSGIVSIEDTWAEFQDTLKQMGVDRMVEIYQDAYTRAAG